MSDDAASSGAESESTNASPWRRFASWVAGVRRRTIERLLHDTFARTELWQMRAEVDSLRPQTRALAEQLEAVTSRVQSLLDEAGPARARSDRLLASLQADFQFQQRRVARLVEQASLDLQVTPPAEARGPREDAVESVFLAFQERFRGTRAEIKVRLRPHLDQLQRLRPEDPGRPVLDVACGRGEWLELLEEAGISAYGVDSNPHAVDSCAKAGLEVRHAGIFEHLASLPEGALGAITALHMIEHLSAEQILWLLDEAHRTLISGGVLLLETSNPGSVMVGACTFHADPTRRLPIAPALGHLFLESRGFVDIEVVFLNPYPAAYLIREDTEAARRINELMYGPQDYALIARRP